MSSGPTYTLKEMLDTLQRTILRHEVPREDVNVLCYMIGWYGIGDEE